jgi:ceramide glucosyltransferase
MSQDPEHHVPRVSRRRLCVLFAWIAFAVTMTALVIRVVGLPAARVPLNWTADACGAGAVFGVLYMLVAAVLTRRFLGRACAEPLTFPGVTVLKPLHGGEHALLENLSAFCNQQYPGPVQYVFGVHDEADPARDVVKRLQGLHPQARISMVVDSRLYGPNRKMSNILNMLPSAEYDILVFADSDVGVGPGYLRGIVGELQQPGVGLVTCLYRGLPDPGFWPRLSAKASNYHFMPSVVMGMALRLARPCFGQTIALRRETLDRIGGFAQFTHHLAEDHAIGEAVRKLGEKVVVPPIIVTHACVETSMSQLISHELRWSRTIRTIDPAGHLGSALTHPVAFGLLAIAFSGASLWSLLLAIAAVLTRFALKLQLDHSLGEVSDDHWLLPVSDLIGFFIFISSYFSTNVLWRGFRFEVGRDGLLQPAEKSGRFAQCVGATSLTTAPAPADHDISLPSND